jgi:hypothetical protein
VSLAALPRNPKVCVRESFRGAELRVNNKKGEQNTHGAVSTLGSLREFEDHPRSIESDRRFAIGIRNSNDKSMRLVLTVGYRVFVCDNTMFAGDFTPALAKHTKHLSLVDVLSIGIDRIQRNFEPMKKQVAAWKASRISDEPAKLVIYRAFVQGDLDLPKQLARRVHDLYFDPQVEEFAPRTTWSLSNAFTSAFKELDPIPQFKATARLASFFDLTTASSN